MGNNGYWIGKKFTEAHKEKIRMASLERGAKPPIITGDKHYLWLGDKASYNSKHDWVRRHFGKPDACDFCEKSGLRGQKIQWANKSGKYLRVRSDWYRLCRSCHVLYDFGNTCRKGHLFTKENTYMRSETRRVCRACQKGYTKKYLEGVITNRKVAV